LITLIKKMLFFFSRKRDNSCVGDGRQLEKGNQMSKSSPEKMELYKTAYSEEHGTFVGIKQVYKITTDDWLVVAHVAGEPQHLLRSFRSSELTQYVL